MATLKKYGLYGVMEQVMLLKCGMVNLQVHFTGGRINEMGMSPAEYFTSNPLEQSMIEGSCEFRSGAIKLLGVGECADSPWHPKVVRPTVKPKPVVVEQPQPAPIEAIPDKVEQEQPQTAAEQPGEDTLSEEESQQSEEAPVEEVPEEETPEEPELVGQVVEVSCVQDAASYLNDQFNIPKNQLKSKAKVLEAAAMHGVTFQGI